MNKLEDLEITNVDFVDAGANPAAHIMLLKRKEVEKMAKDNDVATENVVEKSVTETVEKDVADTATPAPAINLTVNPVIEKSAPVPAQDTVEKTAAVAEFSELTKALKDLADVYKAKIAKAEDAKYFEIAKKYELLGQKPETLAPMLKKAASESPEIYQMAIEAFDCALESIEKDGVFSEVGKRGNNSIGATSQMQIESYAAEIRKNNPKLSRFEALDMAYLQHPELMD